MLAKGSAARSQACARDDATENNNGRSMNNGSLIWLKEIFNAPFLISIALSKMRRRLMRSTECEGARCIRIQRTKTLVRALVAAHLVCSEIQRSNESTIVKTVSMFAFHL